MSTKYAIFESKKEKKTNVRWGKCFARAMQKQQLSRVVIEYNSNRSQ